MLHSDTGAPEWHTQSGQGTFRVVRGALFAVFQEALVLGQLLHTHHCLDRCPHWLTAHFAQGGGPKHLLQRHPAFQLTPMLQIVVIADMYAADLLGPQLWCACIRPPLPMPLPSHTFIHTGHLYTKDATAVSQEPGSGTTLCYRSSQNKVFQVRIREALF